MKTYDGFRIQCGCTCAKCHNGVVLEGYADADGAHYCPHHDDYVKTDQVQCKARTPEKVRARQARIIEAGALDD